MSLPLLYSCRHQLYPRTSLLNSILIAFDLFYANGAPADIAKLTRVAGKNVGTVSKKATVLVYDLSRK